MKRNFFLKLIKPISAAIIGLFVLSFYNIYDNIEFVPSTFKFEAGMTTYFAVIDLVIEYFIAFIENKFSIIVEGTFYQKPNEPNISENPILNFKSDVTEIHLKINVEGNAKRLRNASIEYKLPPWITVQTNSKQMEINKDSHGFSFKPTKIIPLTQKTEKATTNILLLFICDEEKTSTYSLSGEIKGLRKYLCKFTTNFVEIKS